MLWAVLGLVNLEEVQYIVQYVYTDKYTMKVYTVQCTTVNVNTKVPTGYIYSTILYTNLLEGT